MSKAILLVVLLIVTAVLAGCGGSVAPSASAPAVDTQSGSVLVLSPTADATLDQAQPAVNFGTAPTLREGYVLLPDNSSTVRRSLLRFDLSSLPANAVINGATLSLYQTGASGGPFPYYVGVYRSTATWTETGVTWASNSTSYSTKFAQKPVSTATRGTWITFNLLAAARSWHSTPSRNFGVMLVGADGGDYTGHVFASREATPVSHRPKLKITYSL